MRLLVAFLLALLLLPAAASAHYGRAVSAEQAVYASHYNGRCGQGTFSRCVYVGVPVADYSRYDHWWHFRNGYYKERRFGFLYECFVRGWVMVRSARHPHNPRHAEFIILNSWVKCRRP